MTRHRAFQTAAARRRQDPITWDIDGTEIQLLPSVDLAAIGELTQALRTDDDLAGIDSVIVKRERLLTAIRKFILPASVEAFNTVEADLDFFVLVEMHNELLAEYAGAGNPTKRASSSDGSPTTGESSTDGAQPEGSTPSDSQPTEP